MPNPYVNKVQKADGTVIIDISDTTAVASDVASGKYFYTAAGEKVQGTASGAAAISIVDEMDSHGGTIRHINGVSLQGDTIAADKLLYGYTAHDASGTAITGSYSPPSAGTEGTPVATKGTVSNHAVTVTPSVTNTAGVISGGTHTGTAVTVSASELVSGSETKTANGTYDVTNLAQLIVNVSGGGSLSVDTKTVTASNYPVSISFSSMKGEPKYFFLRSTSQISSSGSTTYYYIIDMRYDGNTNKYCNGNVFRIGSTRRVEVITTASSGGVVTGYTWSYSGTTLTITSSAASRSASPGSFNNTYELIYFY